MSNQVPDSSASSPRSELKALDVVQLPQGSSQTPPPNRIRNYAPSSQHTIFTAEPVAQRHWYVVGFNKDGQEVTGGEHPSVTTEDSQRIVDEIQSAKVSGAPYTDVFVISHGWKHTETQAVERYETWIAQMIETMPPEFKSPDKKILLVCVYWPSAPVDDDVLSVGPPSEFKFKSSAKIREELPEVVQEVQKRLGVDENDAEASAAIETLLSKPGEDPQATETLLSKAQLPKASMLDPRRRPLDPEGAERPMKLSQNTAPDSPFSTWNATLNPRILLASTILKLKSIFGLRNDSAVIRELSFWLMRDRAVKVGETGVHQLLRKLQEATDEAGGNARYHLMGHSFGCAVVSAAIAGPPGGQGVTVDTLYLAQGALSLWSYAYHVPQTGQRIPPAPVSPNPGYYNTIPRTSLVRGPIVTTYSKHDRAVRIFYPAAESLPQPASFDIIRWARQKLGYGPPVLSQWPDFGAVGAFGIRDLWMSPRQATPPGPKPDWINVAGVEPPAWQSVYMGDRHQRYDFQPGTIYNLCADAYIYKIQNIFSGAHNMITEPEVAHAFWEAICATPQAAQ